MFDNENISTKTKTYREIHDNKVKEIDGVRNPKKCNGRS
jgi:hypothetical protein